jgi:hypothetical protein
MPLRAYGVPSGGIRDTRREGAFDTPHYQIHIADDAGPGPGRGAGSARPPSAGRPQDGADVRLRQRLRGHGEGQHGGACCHVADDAPALGKPHP